MCVLLTQLFVTFVFIVTCFVAITAFLRSIIFRCVTWFVVHRISLMQEIAIAVILEIIMFNWSIT